MPRAVVCYKWVPAENELRLDPVTRAVDTSSARWKVSDYDRNAIEAGRVLAAERGAELVALTFGDAGAKASQKDVLARGADRAVHVVSAAAGSADGHVTAHALAAQVRALGDVEVVLCGEGAADTYAHEVGPRVAEVLGWPVVTNVRELAVQGERLHAVRVVGGDLEAVECDLPAVVTVLAEVGPAPIPGLKAVIAAGRKPGEQVAVDALGLAPDALTPRTVVTRVTGYAAERSRVLLDAGEPAERVAALVSALTETGAL